MTRPRAWIVAAALLLIVSACGSSPGTPMPARPASAGPASDGRSSAGPTSTAHATSAAAASDPWQSADVAQPSPVTTSPSLPPGYRCDPCHFLAEDQFLGQKVAGIAPVARRQ